MKVITLILVYKRPEVTAIMAENLERFIREVTWEVTPVFVLSPEDCHLKENEEIIKSYGYKCVYFRNLPVSDKMNAGIRYVMNRYEFDYMMNLGSDDLIHPEIERLYEPLIAEKRLFWGIDSLFFFDLKTRKTFHFTSYNPAGPVGAGRMIHYSLLKRLHDDVYPVYPPGLDAGLDTFSALNIMRVTREVSILIKPGTFPYIVDVKTDTNINHLMHIESKQTQIQYFKEDHLTQYFKL